MGIRRSTQKVRSRGDLEGARKQIINHYTIGQTSYNGESGTGWNAQGRRLMEQGSCTYEGLMMEGYEHLAAEFQDVRVARNIMRANRAKEYY